MSYQDQPPYINQTVQSQINNPHEWHPETPPKKKRSRAKTGVFILLAMIIVALIAFSIILVSTFVTSVNTQYPSVTPTPAKNIVNAPLTVGQSGLIAGWQVQLQTVATTNGDVQIDSSQLKSGETFLMLHVALTNTSPKDQNISSALNFILRDATGQQYTETIISTQKTAPDGLILSQEVIAGDIVYKVPVNQRHFTLSFQPDVLQQTAPIVWAFQIK